MSETANASPAPLWPRDARPPAVPGRAPLLRHRPPAGVAGFDWLLRHRFALRREERFLAAAIAAPAVPAAADAPGDIGVAQAQAAFAATCAAAGVTATPVLRRRVLALLRGCYVVMPPDARAPAVALAAAVAARCGLAVHIACEDQESAESLRALVDAALADSGITAVALGDSAADLRPLTGMGARVVCAPAAMLAHAWLRWDGEESALARASAWLGGSAAPAFSYAALLLSPDGERVLLDLLRHPLQITRAQAEDSAAFMMQLAQATAAWQDGTECSGRRVLPAGTAQLREAAERQGGPWAVPKLLASCVEALLIARGCVPERDFVLEGARLRWLAEPDVADAAQRAQVELALRCLHGQPAAQRVRRRAWFIDFLAGYPRIGAAGANLGEEWRDLWWLHGMPVLDNHARQIAVEWWTAPLEALVADGGRLAVAQARLLGLPGLPPDMLNLEAREGGRDASALLEAGTPLRVLGAVAASRHLPDGLSSIILAADARLLPGAVATLARAVPRWGGVGRLLGRLIGRWVLQQAAAQRFRLRRQLQQRRQQERRTYAFIGDGRDD